MNLPSRLEELGASAFRDDDKITEVMIPKTLKTCGDHYVGGSLDSEWGGPFFECDGLKNVTFENGMDVIPENLFYKCPGIETVTIPFGITRIGAWAFADCDNLGDLTIEATVTSIDKAAFKGCGSLEELTIPDSVKTISECAFQECSGLKSVKLSTGLTSLGGGAFADCDSIASIAIPNSLEACGDCYFEEGGFFSGKVWGGPFLGCDGLKQVTFEAGMTKIPANLFYYCSGIETVVVPEGITEIEDYAFGRCHALKEVSLPSTLTTLRGDAFIDGALVSMTIPDSVTYLGAEVLAENASLTSVNLPATLTELPSYTFAGCKSLEGIDLPGITSIGRNAFEGCSALSSVSLGAGLRTIGDAAFKDCDALQAITIPHGVTSLGSSVFYDCDALTKVTLGHGITCIPYEAFFHCDSLEKVVLPYGIGAIEGSAFAESVNFTTVYIPRATTSIADNAFSYFTKLTILGVEGSTAQEYATRNNAQFTAITRSADSVAINTPSVTVNRDETLPLDFAIDPEDYVTDEVIWKSSNGNIVSVGHTGIIEAHAVGTTTVKLVVGDKSAVCSVTVLQPVWSVYLSEYALSLESGDTFQLSASVYPDYASNKEVVWSTSDPSVATVDQTGKVTALKKGSAVVSATAADGSGSYSSVEVTVTNDVVFAQTVDELESPHNYASNSKDAWVYTSSDADADSLKVTFDARTSVEEGSDYIYLYTGTGATVGSWTGAQLAGQTVEVPGNTVKIRLVSDAALNEWGFKVTSVVAVKAQPPAKTPVSVPTAASITYDGLLHVGVPAGKGYKLSGVYQAMSAGSYVATATLLDGYVWSDGSTDPVKIPWSIAPASLSGASILGLANATYTGKAITPTPLVLLNGKTLVKGIDYTVGYKNNKNAGTATVTIKGAGNYAGTATATFKINKAASTIKLAAQTKTYTGKALKYSGKVTTNRSSGITYKYYSDAKCTKEVKAANVKAAKTYYVKAVVAASTNYKSATSAAVKFTVAKAANPVTAKAKSATVTVSNAKAAKRTIAASKWCSVAKAQGKVTYKKASSGNAKITVAANGTITVAKGTAKGKYTIKVSVTAAGNANYKAGKKTVQVTVVVK